MHLLVKRNFDIVDILALISVMVLARGGGSVVEATYRVCGLYRGGTAEKQVVRSSLGRVTGCEPGYA